MDNQEYIRNILLDSQHSHLADSFDLLPQIAQEAIETMVTKLLSQGKHRSLIQVMVVADVAAGLEGKALSSLQAYRYMNHETIGTL